MNTISKKFFSSSFCLVLIIVLAVLFAFGATCTAWKILTKNIVSDGNVFGYTVLSLDNDNLASEYKKGTKVVVKCKDINDVPSGAIIVYNSDNSSTYKYSACKLLTVNHEDKRMTIQDDLKSDTLNEALYIGAIIEQSDYMVSVIDVLNSSIMIWLFDAVFGVLTIVLIICRKKANQ